MTFSSRSDGQSASPKALTPLLDYFLRASGLLQQVSGSEHEQAPFSLSAQDLSTWISNPQPVQT